MCLTELPYIAVEFLHTSHNNINFNKRLRTIYFNSYFIFGTGIERLAAVTGGEIASTFDKPELVSLGTSIFNIVEIVQLSFWVSTIAFNSTTTR